MTNNPAIIFDTSALNRLADDKDSTSLVAGVTTGFAVRLTGTNIDEIIANPSAGRRQQLLNLCKRLLSAGNCIQTYHLITKNLITQSLNSLPFDWRTLDVRFPEYEHEI